MSEFKEFNESTSLAQQMNSNDEGSVVLVNVFTIDPSEEEELVAAWSHDAAFMRQQPGYISTQLHKGVGGSPTFFNYAIWESIGLSWVNYAESSLRFQQMRHLSLKCSKLVKP